MDTYYKVVRVREDGRYVSAIAEPPLEREYRLGEETTGVEGTPVLVFGSLKAARAFRLGKQRILVGQAGNPREQALITWLEGGGVRAMERIRRFWMRGNKWRGDWVDAPRDTYAADWFTPQSEV